MHNATITKREVVNFSVLMYFLFMIITNQVENYIFFVGFYSTLMLCGIAGLLSTDFRLQLRAFLVFSSITLILVLTAGINTVLVGNARIEDVIFIAIFAFASFSLTSEYLEEKTLLIAFALYAIVILYKFVTVGVMSDQLFTHSSRNFVSVYLMYPLVVYYSIVDKKAKEIKMLPVAIAWIFSLYARGRGGIISSTFFMVGVCLVKYKDLRLAKKIIAMSAVIVVAAVILRNYGTVIQRIRTSDMMFFFTRNGMRSSRTSFWPEYIQLATENSKNLLFGANVSDIFIGQYLEGNPHNSFIEMHMLNGIFGLAVIVITLIKNGIQSIMRKNYLYLVCMLSILLRAFTDHVLWAAYGTPILFFFLFFYNYNTVNISVNSNGGFSES